MKWMPKRRRYRVLAVAGVVMGVLLAVRLGLGWYWARIDISPETTRLTGPLYPDGTVNYFAALRATRGAGVTPENNAAVLLVEAVGTDEVPAEIRAEFLAELGIAGKTLPAKGVVKLESFDRMFPEALGEINVHESDQEFYRRPWKAEEFPGVAAWLEKNAAALELWEKAAERPRYYSPLVASPSDTTLLGASFQAWQRNIRELACLAASRAMLRLAQGDIDGAWSDAMRIHRTARLLSQSPEGVIGGLRGMSCEARALETLRSIAIHGKLSREQVQQMQKVLAALPRPNPVTEAFDSSERLLFLDMLQAFKSRRFVKIGLETPPLAYLAPTDFNHGLREINSYFDRLVASARLPKYAERKAARAVLETELEACLNKRFLMTLQEWVRAYLMPSLGRAAVLDEKLQSDRDVTLLALALAAYHAERGEYPAALGELEPNYLEKVPMDRFTDAPLSYRRKGKGYVLFSVGPDLKDNTTGAKHPRKYGDDIVVETE